MKLENKKSLENLSLFCHFCGLVSIFLGILIVAINVMNAQWQFIQVGIYVFAIGYAFVKISNKISSITIDEERP